MSDCDKNEVYPSKLAKMSEFRHIFSRATLWVDIAKEYQWCLKNANEGYCKLHYKDAASYMEKNGFVFKVK